MISVASTFLSPLLGRRSSATRSWLDSMPSTLITISVAQGPQLFSFWYSKNGIGSSIDRGNVCARTTAVDVGSGVALGDGVAVGSGVAVRVAVAVGSGVAVNDGVAVAVLVAVAVGS